MWDDDVSARRALNGLGQRPLAVMGSDSQTQTESDDRLVIPSSQSQPHRVCQVVYNNLSPGKTNLWRVLREERMRRKT